MSKVDVSTAVALYPKIVDGEWDGTIQVVLEEFGLETLDEETSEQLQMFTGMVAATISMMNENPDMMMRVQTEYLKRMMEMEEQHEHVEKAKRYTRTGDNVFQLHAATKTEGNA